MLYIMIIFSIIGAIDKILDNKYGLGAKFDEGFRAMGSLALTIIGLYSLSPIIAKLLIPVLGPLANVINTDPSVFIGSILATDLGAYTTSIEIAENQLIGNFNGLILASMLGSTISFTIPVALNLVSIKDYPYFIKGVLSGIVTIPIGMLVSGIMMKVPMYDIIFNIIPVGVFAIFTALGLIKAEDIMMKIFETLGIIIKIICTLGLVLSMVEFSFGITLIEGMIPFKEGVMIVAGVCIVLSGAYPLLYFISVKLHKMLRVIHKKYDLDQYSVLGIISSLANCVPMLGIYENMNWKGKILNGAFAVSGSFVIGGQLGYVSSVAPEFVNPFIVGKLAAGLSAMAVAFILIKIQKSEEELKNEYQ